MWQPLTVDQYERDPKAHSNMPLGDAWMLVQEMIRDRTSHCYMALAGWYYAPTGAELAYWDGMAAEKRLKRATWRPWTDRASDPLRDEVAEKQRAEEARRAIDKYYHIRS